MQFLISNTQWRKAEQRATCVSCKDSQSLITLRSGRKIKELSCVPILYSSSQAFRYIHLISCAPEDLCSNVDTTVSKERTVLCSSTVERCSSALLPTVDTKGFCVYLGAHLQVNKVPVTFYLFLCPPSHPPHPARLTETSLSASHFINTDTFNSFRFELQITVLMSKHCM